MKNRRQSMRTAVTAEAIIHSETIGTVECRIRDLSDHGVFVVSQKLQDLKQGDFVTVQAIGFKESMPKMRSVVARVQKEGLGLQFID